MKGDKILNISIDNFVENNIYKYKGTEDITFSEMLKMYLESGGLFILEDSDKKVLAYLDLSNAPDLKKLMDDEEVKSLRNSEIKKLINKIPFNRGFVINMSEKTGNVRRKLSRSGKIFAPVVNNDMQLIGRISERIIRKRVDLISE